MHKRCIFHLHPNTARHLTRNPRTSAGKALRQLAMQLSDVDDEEDAISWQLQLDTPDPIHTFWPITPTRRCTA